MLVLMVLLCSMFAPPASAKEFEDSVLINKCAVIKAKVILLDLDKAYLVEYIVKCTTAVVKEVFGEFLQGFYNAVFRAGQAVLTLAVTIFGVMLATGAVEKASRDGFVVLFKLGCVLYFVQPHIVTWIFNSGLDAMEELTNAVYQFGNWGQSGRCFDVFTLWDRLDCTLDVLIGTVKDTENGAQLQGVSRGMLHFFASNMASTSLGAIIGMLGFYVTYEVVLAVIKSLHTYLAAIIALAFILMFAPLFVPMIMFKVTRSFFDKWMRIAISFILQPVILFGFLSMMMIAMETMMLTGPGSLLKTIDPSLDQKNKFVSEALENQGAFGSKMFERMFDTGNTAERNIQLEDTGATGMRGVDKSVKNADDVDAAVAGMGSMNTRWDKVQYAKLKNCGSAEECQKRIAMVMVTMALTAFVFVSMLNYIPNLATDLSGGIYEVPSLYKELGSKIPGAEMLGKGVQGGANAITENARRFTEGFRDTVRRNVP